MYGLKVKSNNSTFDMQNFSPVSCVLGFNQSINENNRKFERTFYFNELPDGVILYAHAYIDGYWYKRHIRAEVRGKSVYVYAWMGNGALGTTMIQVYVFADFRNIKDRGYGFAFNQGVWTCFSSKYSPLNLLWKMDTNLNDKEYLAWTTPVDWNERLCAYIHLDSTDTHNIYLSNDGGKARLWLRRAGGRWGNMSERKPVPANCKIVIFGAKTPEKATYGIRFRRPNGSISWESYSTPQIPAGMVTMPYIKDLPPKPPGEVREDQIIGVQYITSVPSGKKLMFPAYTLQEVQHKTHSDHWANSSAATYYDRYARKLSLQPMHKIGGIPAAGQPKGTAGSIKLMPFLEVSDYF